jgi:phosphatidylglycerophosphatase A
VSSKKGSSLSKNPTQSTIQQQIISLLVKGFGTGLSPWMPGTFGSLLALLLVYIVGTLQLLLALQICFAAAFTLLSWYLIYLYEAQTHKHDDSQVVIDEFAGIFITFIGVTPSGLNLVAGFILFRILDIVKPFPIGWIDKNLPGAAGTLFDDVLAGVVACGLLHFFVLQGWL